MASKKATDRELIDAIVAVLAANGMSLPEVLGGTPPEPDPEPEIEPADNG